MHLPMKLLILLLFTPALLATTIPDYNRSDWNHWIDADGDCQNTRHELLLRESLVPAVTQQLRGGVLSANHLSLHPD